MKKAIRVLHCIPHLHGGGADRGAANLVRDLNTLEGVSARLCVFQGKKAPASRLEGLDQPVLLDFRGSHWRLDEFLRFRNALRKLVAEWRPDILHSHLWPACRWVGSALDGFSVRQVWHIRDTRSWLTESGLRNMALRAWTRGIVRRQLPAFIGVSRAAADYTAANLGIDLGKLVIISSGVDHVQFRPPRNPVKRLSNMPTIGMAAQFRPEKDHDVLIRAAHILKKRGVPFHLRLAGDGQMLEPTQRLSHELGLAKQVEFLGHIENIPDFLRSLDVFVLSSAANEGLPLSVLEAMSMRVPVVATAGGGTPEVVRDGETGFLIPPGDESALASALERAVQDKAYCNDMLDNAERLVREHHSSEIVASKVLDVYQKILARTTVV